MPFLAAKWIVVSIAKVIWVAFAIIVIVKDVEAVAASTADESSLEAALFDDPNSCLS